MKKPQDWIGLRPWIGLIGLGLLTTSLLPVLGNPATPGAPPLPGVGEPGGPSRSLSPAELQTWLRGRRIFDKPFHIADGLGAPGMNADSCRGCHQDPAIGGAGGLELNVSRFGFDDDGDGPFTNLPGGQGLSKLQPPQYEGREEYDPMTADVFEQRQTPTLFGAGFIDGIPGHVIAQNEDSTDKNNDGIFGLARRIETGTGSEVGRFGWKGQIPRLEDFIRDAMGGELGVTTADDGRGFALVRDNDNVPDPELPAAELSDMLFFLSNLAAPKRIGSTAPEVVLGEILFDTVGCATCHIPELEGAAGPVPLYSNLLIHNVMPPDYRGMSEPGAEVGFFQTPPLWGIRDTAPYMHDGRAETIRDAILAHFGEAMTVRTYFEALSASDQDAILAFLSDL